MGKVDLDKFICAMMRHSMLGRVIDTCLRDQGLECDWQEIKPIEDSEKADDEEFDELSLRDGDSRGITLQFTAGGRNVSDFRISAKRAKVLASELFLYVNKPIIDDADIKSMVFEFKRKLLESTDITYVPVAGIMEAYEKGLNDMFFKFLREGGEK